VKVYFQIQWQIINRHLKEIFGLPLYLVHLIIVIAFAVLSFLLLSNYQYAEYVYILFPVFFASKLAKTERQQFLIICYGAKKCHEIRLVENVMLALPFVVLLLVFQHYLFALFLIVSAFCIAYFELKTNFSFVLPTPFRKRPFEFIVGFRNTFFIIFLIFAVSIIAVIVNNYYLGLFALIVGFLTSLSYYTKVESVLWVWVHTTKPKRFLLEKVKIALLFNSLLYLPSTLILIYFFYDSIFTTLVLYIVGNASLLLIIFAKYAAFPRNIGVKEGIIISVGIYFPPLLLVLILFFYLQSLKSLNEVLK